MARFVSQFFNSNLKRWLIAAVAVLLAISLLFDWDWFRPPLEQYLRQKSHRNVTIGHLDVDFSISLQPTVRMQDLYIENAPWSSNTRPLIAVKEITFTFATFKMLFEEFRLISLITVSDGEVNLEALENGLRNWRLQNPDYRGPGQYLVMAVNAHRTTIRLANRAIQLEVAGRSDQWTEGSHTNEEASATSHMPKSAEPTNIGSSNMNFSKYLTFSGSYRGNAFSGTALTGTTWQLQKTGQSFPVQAYVVSGKTRLDINGQVADILRDQMVDANMHISTPSLSRLNPLLPYNLPDTHTIDISLHLRKTGQDYRASHMQAIIGDSQFSGNLAYFGDGETTKRDRAFWQGQLASKAIHMEDIVSIKHAGKVSTDASIQKSDRHNTDTNTANKTRYNKDSARLFSKNALLLESMNSHDADISLTIAKLVTKNKAHLQDMQLTANLSKGLLTLKPMRAKLAGGIVEAELKVDAQQHPASASMDIRIQNIALGTLLKGAAPEALVSAPLTGNLRLQGTGNSLAEILGRADGKLQLSSGAGSISNKLDAKLGLDGGKLLWLSLRGDKAIAVHCAIMQFHFKQGIGTADRLFLDTAQTYLTGTGTINLRDEQLHLMMVPAPKDPTLFSLNSVINIHGHLAAPSYSLAKKSKDTLPLPVNNSEKSGC